MDCLIRLGRLGSAAGGGRRLRRGRQAEGKENGRRRQEKEQGGRKEAEESREKWEEGGMDGKEIRGLKQEGEEGKIKKGSRKELRKGGE